MWVSRKALQLFSLPWLRLLLPALTLVYFRVGRSATPRAVDRLLRWSREICRFLGALLCTAFVVRRRTPPSLSFTMFAGVAMGVLSSAFSAEVPSLIVLLGGALAPRVDGGGGDNGGGKNDGVLMRGGGGASRIGQGIAMLPDV
jgi:hypothetical protein